MDGHPVGSGLGHRPGLHEEQAGDLDPEPDAAQPEHRVLLVEAPHVGQQGRGALVDLAALLGQGDLDAQVGEVRQELVQRRVEEPDGDGQAVHRLEDLGEVLALQRQERGQRLLDAGLVLGDDQLLHQLAPLAEEHVLGAAQADALGAEATCAGGVLGGVGVGPHPQAAGAVGVRHDPRDRVGEVVVELLALEVAYDDGVGDRDRAGEHLARRAVDGDHVSLADGLAVADAELLGLGVYVEGLGAAHARTPHAARDDGGVRGLAAPAGEDAASGDHPAQVVGVGLLAHQDHVLAPRRPRHGGVGVEDALADGGTG